MQNAGHDAAAAALLALSPGPARQAEKESRSPQTAVIRLAHWGGTGEKGEIWIANCWRVKRYTNRFNIRPWEGI